MSVVIPTYNRFGMVEDAVKSICRQTYSNIELVIVDDHSKKPVDEVCTIESEYPVQILRHETNKGANAARNTGIRNSDGKYIAFLDDDDEWHPDKIRKHVREFQSSTKNCGLTFANVEIVGRDGRAVNVRKSDLPVEPLRELLKRNFVGTFSNVMVKSDIFAHIGMLDEDLPNWQDWDFYIRVARNFGLGKINELLVKRHIGRADHISQSYSLHRSASSPHFISKYLSVAEDFGIESDFLAWIHIHLAQSAASEGEFGWARRHSVIAIIYHQKYMVFYLTLLTVILGRYTYQPFIYLKVLWRFLNSVASH